MPSRRRFIQAGLAGGAAAAIGAPYLLTRRAEAATIDPTTIPKYVTPLFILPAMPPTRVTSDHDEFSVAARHFTQQILPAGMPATPVIGMGAPNARTNRAPGYTIEMKVNRQARVTWRNEQMDSQGNFLPALLTIDPTLHWANPPGGVEGRDSQPTFTSTPPPYTGPMPFVVHHHGSRDFEESDGFPECWFLPPARNIPAGYATVGSAYDQFKQEAFDRWGVVWQPGTMTSVYPNEQPAASDWYHDHSLGVTRTSVHSGLVGMINIRGGQFDLPAGVLPGPAPMPGDAAGKKYREINLVLQDKAFNTDGSVSFPTSRAEFANDHYAGPYIPETDIPPYWNPFHVPQVITVNGNTWPFLEVEARRYRFRILGAANMRTWMLKVVTDPLAQRPATAALPIWVIGSDGGYLAKPAPVQVLPIITAERYDVIIDFTGITPGTKLYLTNDGTDANTIPGTSGQIMQFRVVAPTSTDTSVPPDQLQLPGFPFPGDSTVTRKVSFQFLNSADVPGITNQFLAGNVNADGTANPLDWSAPITETPALNATETWEVHNFTGGAHAFHIHLIQFQLLDRQPIGGGTPQPPAPHEVGPKDTVMIPGPGITRWKAKFDLKSMYVWHCHFVDHEDNGMMRPWRVV